VDVDPRGGAHGGGSPQRPGPLATRRSQRAPPRHRRSRLRRDHRPPGVRRERMARRCGRARRHGVGAGPQRRHPRSTHAVRRPPRRRGARRPHERWRARRVRRFERHSRRHLGAEQAGVPGRNGESRPRSERAVRHAALRLRAWGQAARGPEPLAVRHGVPEQRRRVQLPPIGPTQAPCSAWRSR
jgi:hypothetical protein